MSFSGKKLARTLLALGVVALLLSATFGIPHLGMTMTMDMDGNMTMSDCLMPGMTAVCNMTPLAHITTWQSAFAGLAQQYGTVFLLLLLSLAVVAMRVGWIRQQYPPPEALLKSFRRYVEKSRSLPVAILQELFSNGILNPKLYYVRS